MICSSVEKPWLKDVKIAHDWEKNIVLIQENGTIRIIIMKNHLGVDMNDWKCCYATTIRMVS
jgi:hypothetical protein